MHSRDHAPGVSHLTIRRKRAAIVKCISHAADRTCASRCRRKRSIPVNLRIEGISRKGAKHAKADAKNNNLPLFLFCGLPLRSLRLCARIGWLARAGCQNRDMQPSHNLRLYDGHIFLIPSTPIRRNSVGCSPMPSPFDVKGGQDGKATSQATAPLAVGSWHLASDGGSFDRLLQRGPSATIHHRCS
jgi:hypothetical protein